MDIEILGHKGKITRVSSQPAHPPWFKEEIVVWISFDESVEGLQALGTTIPVSEYSKAGFMEVVKEAGERDLPRTLESHRKEREDIRAKVQRREEIDALVKRIETMLCL